MMFGKAFKTRSYYVFDYKPRYYDERKERIEDLKKKYNGESLDHEISNIKLTKNNLKTDWVKNKKSAPNRATNIRLAVIITILVGIVAYIFELHKAF
ncbi:hypothetical protein [Urechidicola croceus]|uniref:Riboflavin synthase subunit beta n=1 Tax=Urechidicola croceus TaxID=1850246 RepID=A0A1D8P616_9FLAO|nr:hypothetical protein [Urechidicola croceus]AOW19977.1 hypothetical protein LPB138_04435 [Urechidicola croceus]